MMMEPPLGFIAVEDGQELLLGEWRHGIQQWRMNNER